MISIILPVLNEERHNYLEKLLSSITQQSDYELIIVDSNSTDNTTSIAEKYGKVIQARNVNRAMRMNIGAQSAQGDILLFHHPRTVLPRNATRAITEALSDESIVGGGFSHSMDIDHPLITFTSWYANKRAKRGIIYLDHCIFVRKKTFEEIGGFPNVDIFEDTIFPLEMKKRGKTTVLPEKIITSGVRFRNSGILKQGIKNTVLKAGFHLGVHPNRLNKIYEGKNPFNVKY